MQEITAYSRGRINIIGEHTDYNDGFVLPAAIDKKAVVRIRRNGDNTICNVTAENKNESYQFDLKKYEPIKSGWQNYVMGVVHELEKLGGKIKGFDASFSGDVPIGSGMSSSAALECSFALALNELFDLGFDRIQLIKAAQRAEHNYVGNKCGIMDQFASMMGRKGYVMLLDCRSLEYQYFPLELGEHQLLLLNTNVAHSLADTAYNERRAQCEEGVQILEKQFGEIKSLRNVTKEMLEEVKSLMNPIVFNKCKHVVKENQRVLAATAAMQEGQLEELGKLIYASHHSLQYDFEVSCKELDFLVEDTKDRPFILGSRMMGGGFGGCTINLIEKKFVADYINQISSRYFEKFKIELTPYEVTIEDGAGIISA